MPPADHPLTLAIAALLTGISAWIASNRRTVRRSSNTSQVERLVSDAVTRQYHQLVSEVAELRVEVTALQSSVKERDARIDELEADKRLAQSRIEELEREVSELRDELAQYQPRRRAPRKGVAE
jgi:chromosome segregation ATPase